MLNMLRLRVNGIHGAEVTPCIPCGDLLQYEEGEGERIREE